MPSGFAPNGLAYAPDQDTVVIGDEKTAVFSLWKVPTAKDEKQLELLQCADRIYAIAFSPNGKYLATGNFQGLIVVYNRQTFVPERKFKCPSQIRALAFSSDSQRFMSGSEDGSAFIWHLSKEDHEVSFEKHADPVLAVGFSADGQRACTVEKATARPSKVIRAWTIDLPNKKATLLREVPNPTRVGITCAKISPSGVVILGGREGKVWVWNFEKGGKPTVLGQHDRSVDCVDLSSNGRRALSGGSDRFIRYWRLPAELTSPASKK